jgi:hypothetical protein
MAAVAVRLSANSTPQVASLVTVLLAALVVTTGMQDQLATQVHLVKSVPRAKLATPARIGHLSVPAVSLAALPVASATQDLLVMTVHLVVTLAIVMQDLLVTLVHATTARHVVTLVTATV